MFIQVQSQEQIQTVAKIAAQIWTEHYSTILSTGQIEYMLERFQSENAIAQQIENGYRYFLVPFCGENAGYFSVIAKDGSMFLSKIYIKKEFRKKGLAAAAVSFIETLCATQGCSKIWLTVNKNNDSVHAYERLGFRITRSEVTDIGSGYVMDDYIMEKETGKR